MQGTAAPAPSGVAERLADALYAAELGEPCDLGDPALVRELFRAMPQLRVTVPYAALRLVERLTGDLRAEVRLDAARALPWFTDLYPDRVERVLWALAGDSSRRVRAACAVALGDLLESVVDPWAVIRRWERQPKRAREVLGRARRRLRPPVGA